MDTEHKYYNAFLKSHLAINKSKLVNIKPITSEWKHFLKGVAYGKSLMRKYFIGFIIGWVVADLFLF